MKKVVEGIKSKIGQTEEKVNGCGKDKVFFNMMIKAQVKKKTKIQIGFH
jgi:hypothetical protein